MSMTEYDDVVKAVEAKVLDVSFPCLGAKSVFHRGRFAVRRYGTLGGTAHHDQLVADLLEYTSGTDLSEGFASFLAVYDGPDITDEAHFEKLLWSELRGLHRSDPADWSPLVSPDPKDPHFGFSLGGTPYFVVGMHPRASRLARRTPQPVLVFNFHEQFQLLRRSGHYSRMREAIRTRDIRLQGSINPMVEDHGATSEARQYSGRPVEADWSAPFPGEQAVGS